MVTRWEPVALPGCEAMVSETQDTSEMRVHPFAALFPMMADDDLADLAADIQANGLITPLVIDQDGQLIDGRNRLAACAQAGVEPRYTTLPPDVNPVDYILSANVERRMLSQGAKAMAIAQAPLFAANRPSQGRLAEISGVSRPRIVYADMVSRWAPELVADVMAGASLDDAYDIARARKAQAEQDARDLNRLEADYPALVAQVNNGDLTLAEARAMAIAQERVKAEQADVARLRQQIALAREEIGDPAPLPARREIAPLFSPAAPQPEFARNGSQQAYALKREHEFLQRLVSVRQQVAALAAAPVLREVSWQEGHLNAVRSAAGQMVTAVYAFVDAHEAALGDGPSLRKVK